MTKALTTTQDEFQNTTRGYTVELREEEDGTWTATVPELPGSVAVGSTPNAAMADLPEVIDLWIEAANERGMPVPAPRMDPEVSGRVLLRMPRDLHRALVNRSRVEGVSLNTYLISSLSASVGESLATRTRQSSEAVYWQKFSAIKSALLTSGDIPGMLTQGSQRAAPFFHFEPNFTGSAHLDIADLAGTATVRVVSGGSGIGRTTKHFIRPTKQERAIAR